MARFIYQMALDNDATFFKQLGKALSGRKYTGAGANKREAFMLRYYVENPNGSNADCMAKMTEAKFPPISEENFRVLKQRLFKKIKIIRAADDLPDEGEYFGALLERNKL
jgi:hypothetical protein